ncbi:hypothetical protein D9M72_394570 [compost metagenome]
MADTMITFLSNPLVWFAGAGFVGSLLLGYIAYEIVSFHYRRKGYEPAVDLDALQEELDREFSPLSVQQAARMTP